MLTNPSFIKVRQLTTLPDFFIPTPKPLQHCVSAFPILNKQCIFLAFLVHYYTALLLLLVMYFLLSAVAMYVYALDMHTGLNTGLYTLYSVYTIEVVHSKKMPAFTAGINALILLPCFGLTIIFRSLFFYLTSTQRIGCVFAVLFSLTQ